jgi:hypothetical protein
MVRIHRIAGASVVAALLAAALTLGLAGAVADPTDSSSTPVTALTNDDLLPAVLPAAVALVVATLAASVLLTAVPAPERRRAVVARDRAPPRPNAR